MSSFYRKHGKRWIDIILSLMAILLLSWLLLLVYLLVRITSPGPALFSQKRIGKGKSYFQLYKFRTMRIDTPTNVPTHLLKNPEQYITPVGKFLRRSSLDELPQLYNILKGDMSIVGPRPALWNQDDLIKERDKYGANDVTPGLTGWAQINGRDELEIPTKAAFDGEYVRKQSFRFDVYIFFHTFLKVAGQSGVKEGGTGRK